MQNAIDNVRKSSIIDVFESGGSCLADWYFALRAFRCRCSCHGFAGSSDSQGHEEAEVWREMRIAQIRGFDMHPTHIHGRLYYEMDSPSSILA